MLWITVHPTLGGHPRDSIIEMVALANKIQCGVTADINGAQALAKPGDDQEKRYKDWEDLHLRRSRLV